MYLRNETWQSDVPRDTTGASIPRRLRDSLWQPGCGQHDAVGIEVIRVHYPTSWRRGKGFGQPKPFCGRGDCEPPQSPFLRAKLGAHDISVVFVALHDDQQEFEFKVQECEQRVGEEFEDD